MKYKQRLNMILKCYKYTKLTFEMMKTNIQTDMEYRFAFLLQIVGMVLNDIAWLILWWLFYRRFPVVRGWRFEDMIILYAFQTIVISLIRLPFDGVFYISRKITDGELDHHLCLPKSVLWQLLTSRTDISAIGDFLFGMGLLIFFVQMSWTNAFLFTILTMLSAIILLSFITLMHSLTFFVGDLESLAEDLFFSTMNFTLFPQSAFTGTLKLITMTILPAFFIATLPMELLKKFQWPAFSLVCLVAVLMATLASLTFHKGLKRYESGNLIQVKI